MSPAGHTRLWQQTHCGLFQAILDGLARELGFRDILGLSTFSGLVSFLLALFLFFRRIWGRGFFLLVVLRVGSLNARDFLARTLVL
jgi:hypothetical protein